jgi:hypothetical protein
MRLLARDVFGQHMLKCIFMSSLALERFSQHMLRCNLPLDGQGNTCWNVFRYHVKMYIESCLVWVGFGQYLFKNILCPC